MENPSTDSTSKRSPGCDRADRRRARGCRRTSRRRARKRCISARDYSRAAVHAAAHRSGRRRHRRRARHRARHRVGARRRGRARRDRRPRRARPRSDRGRACGGRADALAVATDVTDAGLRRGAGRRALAAYGRIDILAANAGIYPSTELADIDDALWDRVMGINVKGALHAVQACTPAMLARGYGRIVLTSSITGPITGQVGLRALRRLQGGDARPDALGRRRARDERHHRQRRDAGQHRDAGARRDERGASAPDALVDPDGPLRHAGGRRLGRALPRLAARPATSRGRR